MAKLADAPALGAGEETRVGSSPSARIFYQLTGFQALGALKRTMTILEKRHEYRES